MGKQLPIERAIGVSRLILNGVTFSEAGKTVSVSTERARQLLHQAMRWTIWQRAKRRQKDKPHETYAPISQIREHKDWWLARFDELEGIGREA